MYSTGRMLRDLALNGQAPKVFTKLTASGTPLLGTTVSAALMWHRRLDQLRRPGEGVRLRRLLRHHLRHVGLDR